MRYRKREAAHALFIEQAEMLKNWWLWIIRTEIKRKINICHCDGIEMQNRTKRNIEPAKWNKKVVMLRSLEKFRQKFFNENLIWLRKRRKRDCWADDGAFAKSVRIQKYLILGWWRSVVDIFGANNKLAWPLLKSLENELVVKTDSSYLLMKAITMLDVALNPFSVAFIQFSDVSIATRFNCL